MKPDNIYEISLLISRLADNLLSSSFERVLVSELYTLFKAENIAFILRDTFREAPCFDCFELRGGEYTEGRFSIRSFSDKFGFSLFDIDNTLQGIVENLSVGTTQKVFHFNAQGIDSLVITKDIRRREFLTERLLKLIISILNFSIYSRITTRELYRSNTVQQYRKEIDILDHEIRLPLSSLKTASQMLSSENLPEEDRVSLYTLIQKSTDELTEIINNINESTKIEQGLDKKKIEDINILDIINETIESLRSLILSKNIDINITSGKDVSVRGNKAWLKIAFHNLILNAIKYNKTDGQVGIFIDEKKGRSSITIKDTGIGIPPDLKKRIFDKYIRGKEHGQLGSGIGLYLVKKSINAHGGKISLKSEVDRGTTFYIEFPRKGKRVSIRAIIYFLIIMSLLVTNIFPLIPDKPEIIETDEITVLKLKEGSILRFKSHSDFAYSYFTTLFKHKGKFILDLNNGNVNIDSKKTDISIYTPYGTINNIETAYDVFVDKDKSGVSVFSGMVKSGKTIVETGEGALINKDVKLVPILYSVKNINYKNDGTGKLRIQWAPIDGVMSYVVLIAMDNPISTIIDFIETETNHIETTIKKDGYYFVRIFPVDEYRLKGFPVTFRLKNLYHLSRGSYERQRGNFEKSITEFKISFNNFNGNEALPLSEIAWTYYHNGNYEMAERKFKEALAIERTNKSLIGLARVYFFKKELTSSENLYKEILSTNPENTDALWGISEVYLAKRNLSEAEKYLAKLNKINKKYPLLNHSIAKLYLLKNNKKEAIKYLKLEIKYNPASKDALRLLRMIRRARKK